MIVTRDKIIFATDRKSEYYKKLSQAIYDLNMYT